MIMEKKSGDVCGTKQKKRKKEKEKEKQDIS